MFRHLGLASCGLLIALTASADREVQIPVLSDPEADARVFEMFAGAPDRDSLTRLLQKPALRCFELGSAGELCEWRLSGDDPGWRALADAAGTRDQVSVLCVLPPNGDPRDPNSCTAHIRRSTRDRWKVQRRPGRKYGSVPIRKTKEHNLAMATTMLSEAGTLVELSRLMGETPGECVANESGRVCLWRTTSHTWGHGTLALIGGINNTRRVRLHCDLPPGNGRRPADSCKIEEGS